MPDIRSPGNAFALAAVVALAACKGAAHAPSGSGSGAVAAGSGGSGAANGSSVAIVADAAVDAAPACVPGGKLLATAEKDKRLRICSDDKKACVDVDPETGALASAAYSKISPPALASARVEKRDKSVFACFEDVCHELGKNARAIIGKDPDLQADALAATTDLGAIVIPKVSPQLWDIRADKKLELRPPSGERDIGQMMPVGNHVFVSWLPAAEAMYRRNGKLVTPLFSGGTQLAMLDDLRSVALTPDHRVLIFGEPEHKIELAPSVGNYDDWVQEPGALAVLADGTVAVVIERKTEAQLVLIDPLRGTVFRRWPLRLCPG